MAASFDSENHLRTTLISSAERVLADWLQPPIVSVTEFPTSDWQSIDLLIIDAAGQISIIECKVNASRSKTREVIGQIFDYAACLTEMHYHEIDQVFARRTGRSIVDGLVEAGMEEASEQNIAGIVAQNMASGQFRLFVAVDTLGEDLKRMVRYINRQTCGGATLFAIEYKFMRDDDSEMLQPSIYGGAPPVVNDDPHSPIVENPENRLFEQIGQRLPEHFEFARQLWDGMLARGATTQSSKTDAPSISLKLTRSGRSSTPLRFYFRGKQEIPVVAVNFGSLIDAFTEDQVSRFASRLRAISSLATHLTYLEQERFKKYPPIPVQVICADEEVVNQVQAALDELFGIEPEPNDASEYADQHGK